MPLQESQPISLICSHQHPQQWIENVRFFLHHGGLHSLNLRITRPQHLRNLGPLIARSSTSLTCLELELHVQISGYRLQHLEGFTLGFLKDCSQLQQLKLGRGRWNLNESCVNAAWMQSLRILTLAYMNPIALEYEFLDAITPLLTEFTLYEVSRYKVGTFSHCFSFSNVRTLRFLFLDSTLKLTLNLPTSLTTLIVTADLVELTCQSDIPLALHQLILYAQSGLCAYLNCFTSAKVIYLNAPARYVENHFFGNFFFKPPSRRHLLSSASSELSWMGWLRTVAPTVEVLIIEHGVPFTTMNVEWSSLRSLGIVAQHRDPDDDYWEIDSEGETSVEDVYWMNKLDGQEYFDGSANADQPDPDKVVMPPSIKAPHLQALFFPSEEESDAQSVATLKHHYPSLALYCIISQTFYWERKGVKLRDAPLVHVRGKKDGSETRKLSKTVREKMHSVNKQLLKEYSLHDENAYLLKVEKGLQL
ncbi:unnamed protein product [Closterium sp. Yama58-4]|nr:unnamed protein product [Closterium sp. Yama58-4]